MSETRRVIGAFAAVGLLLVLVLVYFVTGTAFKAADKGKEGLDGAVSRVFLASEAPGTLKRAVPVSNVLKEGMTRADALRLLDESRFRCDTSKASLHCARSYNATSCKENWSVDLSLDANAAVRTTSAQREATCL